MYVLWISKYQNIFCRFFGTSSCLIVPNSLVRTCLLSLAGNVLVRISNIKYFTRYRNTCSRSWWIWQTEDKGEQKGEESDRQTTQTSVGEIQPKSEGDPACWTGGLWRSSPGDPGGRPRLLQWWEGGAVETQVRASPEADAGSTQGDERGEVQVFSFRLELNMFLKVKFYQHLYSSRQEADVRMRNLAPKFFGTENVKMSNGEMNEFIVLGW